MINQKNSRVPDKNVTEKVITLFEECSVPLNMGDTLESVRPQIQELRTGKCSVVVIGEIKKGKSSLVNALLGLKKVLPVSSDVATSTVFRVVYGQQRRNVVVLRTGLEMAGQDAAHVMSAEEMVREFGRLSAIETRLVEQVVPDDEIYLYGTEDGNPGNAKGVDHIRIELPSAALEHGLEFIDTPGLGGLMKSHAEITWGYIPNAQAVLFVLESVQSPFTKDEQEFLARISKMTSHIMFVQTKIDVVDQVKWMSWKERNLEEISKVLGRPKEEIPYFTVSSEDKQLYLDEQNSADYESSGFKPLEHYLFERLQGVYEQALCYQVLEPIAQSAAAKESELSEALNILKADTAEKLNDLERTYTERQKEFADFETDEFPEMVTRLQDRLQDLISDGEKELYDFLQPNQYNLVVDTFIDKIRNSGDSPKVIHENNKELSTYFTDACAKRASEIYMIHRDRITGFVTSEFELLDRRLSELSILVADRSENDFDKNTNSALIIPAERIESNVPVVIHKETDIEISRFPMIRSAFLGSSVGGTIGAVVGQVTALAVGILFPPSIPFSTAIIGGMSGLGTLLGGIFSHESTIHQQRKELIVHFQQALPGILLQLQKNYARQYSDFMNEVKRNVRDEQRRIIKKMKQQMIDRLKEIQELRKSGAQEAEQRRKSLEASLLKVRNLRRAATQAAGQAL